MNRKNVLLSLSALLLTLVCMVFEIVLVVGGSLLGRERRARAAAPEAPGA